MVRLYLCCSVRHFRRTRDKQMYIIKYIVKPGMRDWECLTYRKEDSDGIYIYIYIYIFTHTHIHTFLNI